MNPLSFLHDFDHAVRRQVGALLFAIFAMVVSWPFLSKAPWFALFSSLHFFAAVLCYISVFALILAAIMHAQGVWRAGSLYFHICVGAAFIAFFITADDNRLPAIIVADMESTSNAPDTWGIAESIRSAIRTTSLPGDTRVLDLHQSISADASDQDLDHIAIMANATLIIWGTFASSNDTTQAIIRHRLFNSRGDATINESLVPLERGELNLPLPRKPLEAGPQTEYGKFIAAYSSGIACLSLGDEPCVEKMANEALNAASHIDSGEYKSAAFELRAESEIDRHDAKAALRALNSAVSAKPTWEAYSRRASVQMIRCKYDQAQKDALKAISLHPSAASYLIGGVVEDDRRNPEKAVQLASRASEFDPRSFLVYFDLSIFEGHVGNLPTALIYANQAAAMARSNRELSFAKTNIADIRDDMGDENIARVAYTEAVSLDDHSATAWKEFGVFEHKNGNYDAAIQDYKRAIEEKPNWALPAYYLCETYAEDGKVNDATQACTTAIRNEPDSIPPLQLRAKLYEQTHKSKQRDADIARIESLQKHAALNACPTLWGVEKS